MALRTVSNTGGNWNATTAWVGGVVPIANDTVDFTVLSGPLVVNVTTAALAGIDFTNYVNTITFDNLIQLNTSLNLGTGGYTQAGTNGLLINANTAISGTTTWTSEFKIAANAAVTLTLSNNLNLTNLSLDGNAASLTFILGGNVVSISNNISFLGNGTYTLNLPHDLQITNLIIGAVNSRTCIINGLFTLSISGNLTQSQLATTTSGTTSILLNGTGTWSNASTGALRNNLTIDTAGTIIVSGNVYYNTNTLTYIQGQVIAAGSTLNISLATTLDTNGIFWNNISFTAGTTTLTSDLNCQNLIINCNSVPQINLKKIYVSGDLQIDGTNLTQGTTEIVLIGNGTWSNTSNGQLKINLTINTNGTIKLGTNIYYNTATLTYTSGKVYAKNNTFNIQLPTTLINCHKIIFDKVVMQSSFTLTMNEFFSGSPSFVTNINSSNINSNYTIAFQDGFEKISKFVNINNCTLSKPLQLLVITNSPRNSTNTRGIRYINQMPNGISKGNPSINVPLAYGVGGLLSDPNMK